MLDILTCSTTETATQSTLEGLAQVELGRPQMSNPQRERHAR